MMHSCLVPLDELLEEEGVVVRCVHGDSVFYLLCNGRIKVHVTGTPDSSCRVQYSTQ